MTNNDNMSTKAISFAELAKNADGLVPVIVQDAIHDTVLMLAYMNEAAYEQTLASGQMTYFSRSRGTIWTKGETSGHFQTLISLAVDCDGDTLLARVSQTGVACHTGEMSCFFKEIVAEKGEGNKNPAAIFAMVMEIIAERRRNPKEGSYTNYLFDKGIDKILKKLGEEATEIVIAAKNDVKNDTVAEIGDYLYHLMVLMTEAGIGWDDVTAELKKRYEN
ncbi:MAG: bifunctional phosphoribosyl-AMP cyclohydrolase/phosphoribosyl-ATP diphosphatase HisIE [Lachnospiraceae bacterium]|jgi:phosphoribosyl-ATP pyrophosphohydrolase/phosphoribosyl-AMP cyclohydrolase|nr:bifunctional phosphoribosyl-AMP cyclohydrolase/phosphoribosyl-ATP diphosphatase HisIE [Lachnospiraceae bacterium]